MMDTFDFIRGRKINRIFRATQKLLAPHLVSHITQRAAGKELLFVEDSDYLSMLSLMKEICLRQEIELYAFCLMPNHIHLLLKPNQENLHEAMQNLFSWYARVFNKKYKRKGHLFGGPYRQAVCLDDRYLLSVSLYIHTNPVRAGIVGDPRDYRWSSIRLYWEDDPPKSFVNPNFVLGLLPGDDVQRREHYRQLLKRGAEIKGGHVLEEEEAIIQYKDELASFFSPIFQEIDRKGREKNLHESQLLDLPDLEKKIAEIRRLRFSRKPETKKAKKYLIEQLIARGYKRSEIATIMGISRKTVYNLLKSP